MTRPSLDDLLGALMLLLFVLFLAAIDWPAVDRGLAVGMGRVEAP